MEVIPLTELSSGRGENPNVDWSLAGRKGQFFFDSRAERPLDCAIGGALASLVPADDSRQIAPGLAWSLFNPIFHSLTLFRLMAQAIQK